MFARRKHKERLLFSKKDRPRKNRSGKGIRVKNVELENSIFRTRMFIGLFCSVVAAGILFANLYYLQIVSYDDYTVRSNENRIRVLPVVPQRGIIYDRNHVVLAENRPVFHLVLFPSKDLDTRESIEKLNSLLQLDLTEDEIGNLIYLSRTRQRFSGVEISDLLSEEQIATFSVNRHRFPNVQISANLNRFYPFADIMTHALGYVSRINQADVDKLTGEGKIDNYEGSTAIGKLGIERYYEDILHGTTGSREVEVDSHGRVIRTLHFNPPKPGLDITLSIDIRLQYYAQELLGNMKGALLAIEPRTGEILAFYSNPSYDPNLFVRGIRSGEYKHLLEHPGRPLINRVTQGGYSPASTVKPLLAVMGLNEGLITTTSTYFGGPAFMLPGSSHRFRDWRSWGHGWLDVYRAIEVSADTYFYDLAHRAGIDTIHDYLDRYGFGRATGIDIAEESLGLNPSREWKMRRYKDSWHMGDTVPIGIGQGYWTTTLLQLVRAHATLANYGHQITPHLLKQVTDPSQDNQCVMSFNEVLRARDDGTITHLYDAVLTPEEMTLADKARADAEKARVRAAAASSATLAYNGAPSTPSEEEESEEVSLDLNALNAGSAAPLDSSSAQEGQLDPAFLNPGAPDPAFVGEEPLAEDVSAPLPPVSEHDKAATEEEPSVPQEAAAEKAEAELPLRRHPLATGPDSEIFPVRDPAYWDVARAGMYLVVNGPEGTGRRAFYGAKYKAAGKSGTAQLVAIRQGEKYNAASLKAEHRDNALFVAFAPYKHPRILVALILENEGGGSAKAAPIARKMIDKYLVELYPNGYMGESTGVTEKFGLGGTVTVQ